MFEITSILTNSDYKACATRSQSANCSLTLQPLVADQAYMAHMKGISVTLYDVW